MRLAHRSSRGGALITRRAVSSMRPRGSRRRSAAGAEECGARRTPPASTSTPRTRIADSAYLRVLSHALPRRGQRSSARGRLRFENAARHRHARPRSTLGGRRSRLPRQRRHPRNRFAGARFGPSRSGAASRIRTCDPGLKRPLRYHCAMAALGERSAAGAPPTSPLWLQPTDGRLEFNDNGSRFEERAGVSARGW